MLLLFLKRLCSELNVDYLFPRMGSEIESEAGCLQPDKSPYCYSGFGCRVDGSVG